MWCTYCTYKRSGNIRKEDRALLTTCQDGRKLPRDQICQLLLQRSALSKERQHRQKGRLEIKRARRVGVRKHQSMKELK